MILSNVKTAQQTELVDAHTFPPVVGRAYLALTHGGKLCEVIWKSDSILYFDAVAEYPKVPASVKRRQMARYSEVVSVTML